jgi:hypothetical protein
MWRRLDVPGHDFCCFEQLASGWQIAGTAIFLHGGVPARLAYRVTCDAAWRTQHGSVQGSIGTRPVAVRVERSEAGQWLLDGRVMSELHGCVHLDYGFTPATNFEQLRQLGLQVGERAELTVAWLDVPDRQPLAMRALPQRYARRSASTYWYESPDDGYAALLELTEQGTIARYPGLWELEQGTASASA